MNNKMFDGFMMLMVMLLGGAALIIGLFATGIILSCKGHLVWGLASIAASIGIGSVFAKYFFGEGW